MDCQAPHPFTERKPSNPVEKLLSQGYGPPTRREHPTLLGHDAVTGGIDSLLL